MGSLPLDRRESLSEKNDAPMPKVEAAADLATGDGGCSGGELKVLMVMELFDHQP